ncbi:16652_t:CDS:1 [Acaulospora morrowiae]|uniref:16652_t:CDS:1 n=1 Tax=Acaulospora morrowiae TaxID=94023 RepID=A0A9N9G966_9GLOM|nr:16652_t:CDS:1 [Acaulospora morrowiae]
MSQTEREVCYLKCIINSGKVEFVWSVITPSSWDWIGLYEDDNKENREWFDGYWFYISSHSSHSSLPDGRHVYTGNHWIETVSGGNQIRLNTYENYREYNTYLYANVHNPTFNYFEMDRVNYLRGALQHIFDRHKEDWGFTENDNWNNRNGEKLQRNLQEFIGKNISNVYSGSFKDDSAYFIVDPVTYKCVIIHRRGGRDYQLWSGWGLSEDQYECATQPPFKLRAVVFIVYEDVLNEIANSEGERNDLINLFVKLVKKDKNHYSDKVYDQISDFFILAEGYIPLSFEGRDEIKPEDNYELDYGKIKKKAGTILGTLEKLAV